MKYFSIKNKPARLALSKNWEKFFLWGMGLFTLGILAILFTTFSTLITVIFLGVLLVISGTVIIIDTFHFWWGKWNGFSLHLLMGILYLGMGLAFIAGPMASSISLTLLLAIFYIVLGISRVINALSLKLPKWEWTLFNGAVSLLLGGMILAEWPTSGLFIIGLFIGIDLCIGGFAYMMMALSAKHLVKEM